MSESDFLDEISGKELNFLIGAGSASSAIPTLWLKSISKSFEELLVSEEYGKKELNVLYYIWFNLWLDKTQVLERITESEDIHKEYEKFIRNIVQLLNNEGFDKPKRANIFTTNYDTFFELAFDEYAKKNRLTYFNDGSKGFLKKYISTEGFYISASHSGINYNFQRNIPAINLVKLHGSVTWINTEELIEVSLENSLFKRIKEKSEEINQKIQSDLTQGNKSDLEQNNMEKLLHENIYNFIFSDKLELSDIKDLINNLPKDLYTQLEEFKVIYDQLPIVSPTKRKFSETVFEQHYYQMLRMLSFELERENSVLIVFGFSFADEHIKEIVSRSMVNPHLQIYVIAFDRETEDRINGLLGKETRIKYFPTSKEREKGLFGDFKYLNSLF